MMNRISIFLIKNGLKIKEKNMIKLEQKWSKWITF
mgnify:CR=1 FL=1|jgi:hypothetical protein